MTAVDRIERLVADTVEELCERVDDLAERAGLSVAETAAILRDQGFRSIATAYVEWDQAGEPRD